MRLLFYLIPLIFYCYEVNAQPADLSSYPLHVQYKRTNKPVVVYFTGDGGWNNFSENLVNELGANGYSTLAIDTRKYFWSQQTPDQFARDMRIIITSYLKTWNKDSFSIVGYSFGAEVGAFLPARFSDTLEDQLSSVVLLSPGISTGFVVKLKNMLNFGSSDGEKYKVYPEILKSKVPVWCIFGSKEDSDFYPLLKETSKIHKSTIAGSHRYNDNITEVTKAIIRGL